ncbi:hypothetical protein [Acutalibacter caecimuris]|uniref:hypothetical protein n=1 Tax=Acutalibacter caecimuris TaxID=3093657 RepID=UPI002AC9531C|nr:hypothetical protein [Acutalibacter sp. M00118]
MRTNEFENLLTDGSLQKEYFLVLRDRQWHCRDCAGRQIGSTQIAGGGGIQGLQRGTKSRPGIITETKRKYCDICSKTSTWDRWTGKFTESSSASGLPRKLQTQIFEHYDYTDSIEQRRRQSHELVIDHRFPMERWGTSEEKNPTHMTAQEIEHKFQLLKKDASGNHNLLKSRACERCIATGKRGYPLGIKFYYAGDENWPAGCPTKGPEAERGCYGCGWYDFEAWRTALNQLTDEN